MNSSYPSSDMLPRNTNIPYAQEIVCSILLLLGFFFSMTNLNCCSAKERGRVKSSGNTYTI